MGHDRPMTTRELFEHCHPRLDVSKRFPGWYWFKVRRAAERFAVRVGRRSRPLLWKLKPGLADGMLRRRNKDADK